MSIWDHFRTCGGGVETWARSCNNPRPNSCVGGLSSYVIYNRWFIIDPTHLILCRAQEPPRDSQPAIPNLVQEAPRTSGGTWEWIFRRNHFNLHDNLEYREEQCAKFNQELFERKYYDWIPYLKAPRKCELNCMPKGERFYYRHAKKVSKCQ